MNKNQERGEVSEDLEGSRIQDGHRRLHDKRRNRSGGGRVGVEISVKGNEKEHLRLFVYLFITIRPDWDGHECWMAWAWQG